MSRWGVATVLALAAALAVGQDAPRPPAPALEAASRPPREAEVEALPEGDPRRPGQFLDLALTRHEEAEELEAQERQAHDEALARWRAARDGPRPAFATPRADARRAEAVRLAGRALDEGAGFERAPEALLVAGLDAERIGRSRDALHLLGALVRRHPESRLVPDAWLALGERHLREGDLTRARAAFEVVTRRGTPAAAAWSWARLAEVALLAPDAEGALGALERALADGSTQALAILDRLGAAHERLGWDRAPLLRLAELCQLSGDAAASEALRARAARAAPGAAAGAARGGVARPHPGVALPGGPRTLLVGGEPFAWRVVGERGAEAAAARLAAYAENTGAAALAAGDAATAEALLARAVAAEPAGWRARLLRALALGKLGRDAEALAEAERVLDLER
ncbi:MAG TPA: tetratricopeptide repeat protein, partial [Anaeromyxobacteraceae bacterium]|nr:tetratricopeptide repeat protein [Anaeromyxobacteraceae bacterium]